MKVWQNSLMVGANKIIGVDLNPEREAMARQFGMTEFANPNEVENVVDHIIQLTNGGARGRTDVPKVVGWYVDGKININDLITHTLPLERINEGFGLMKCGEPIRSVVMY